MGDSKMSTATKETRESKRDRTKEEFMEEEQTQERRRGGDRRNAGQKTRIVIVDGHTLFRRGVRNILELEGDMEVVGEAGSGREALATVEELTPDIILMDLTLPAPTGSRPRSASSASCRTPA